MSSLLERLDDLSRIGVEEELDLHVRDIQAKARAGELQGLQQVLPTFDERRTRLLARLLGEWGLPEHDKLDWNQRHDLLRQILTTPHSAKTSAEAIISLGKMADARSVIWVLPSCNAHSALVRRAVAFALSQYAMMEEAPVDQALIRLARDADTEVRSWAVFGLANSDLTEPVALALKDALKAPDPEVQIEALLALLRVPEFAPYDAVRSAVVSILQDPRHLDDERLPELADSLTRAGFADLSTLVMPQPRRN